ncbi:MAG: hypothetical protein ACR2F6_19060, partial [Mycobacteriales bacterium]
QNRPVVPKKDRPSTPRPGDGPVQPAAGGPDLGRNPRLGAKPARQPGGAGRRPPQNRPNRKKKRR